MLRGPILVRGPLVQPVATAVHERAQGHATKGQSGAMGVLLVANLGRNHVTSLVVQLGATWSGAIVL